MKPIAAWLLGLAMFALRKTCRPKFHADPRPDLRRQGIRFTYAGYHAQQLGCVMTAEKGCAALASRSSDGDMVVPTLEWCGFTVVRGSGGRAKKGGATALQKLIQIVRDGTPGAITVDGPRGPRGKVQPGIGLLAAKADAVIVPVFPRIRSRWIIQSSWDRMQVPLPFSRIDVHFGKPIVAGPDQTAKEVAQLVEDELIALERRLDPDEAVHHYGGPAVLPAETKMAA